MRVKYNNYPLEEIQEACLKQIKNGATIYQKFTCAGCGARLMMDVPNVIFTEGDCDKCGAVTDINKDGCNYLLTATELSAALMEELKNRDDDDA